MDPLLRFVLAKKTISVQLSVIETSEWTLRGARIVQACINLTR